MTRWWIVYGDRSLYSDESGSAWDAPGRDVQVVVASSLEHGIEVWRPFRETNYYVYLPEADTWRGVDLFGLWDYLAEPGKKKVLFGRTMLDKEWHELVRWVDEHPDLPLKTGWRPGER
jgi:hypothetical protein